MQDESNAKVGARVNCCDIPVECSIYSELHYMFQKHPVRKGIHKTLKTHQKYDNKMVEKPARDYVELRTGISNSQLDSRIEEDKLWELAGLLASYELYVGRQGLVSMLLISFHSICAIECLTCVYLFVG